MNNSRYPSPSESKKTSVEHRSATLFCSVPNMQREIVRDGSPKEMTYILPITAALEGILNLPKELTIHGNTFKRKKEFHITLLGFGTRALLKRKSEEAAREGRDLLKKIDECLSDIDFSFSLRPEEALLVRNLDYNREAILSQTGPAAFESEATVILGIEMPGIATFYKLMCDLGIDLGEPAAHVTLYIQENGPATGLGIAITDMQKQLEGTHFPHIALEKLTLI